MTAAEVRPGDVRKLPAGDGAFDTVVLTDVLLYLKPADALRAFRDALDKEMLRLSEGAVKAWITTSGTGCRDPDGVKYTLNIEDYPT